MNAIILMIISTSGVTSLLMPSSPAGVTTSFSMSKYGEAIFYNPANFEASEKFTLQCSYNQFYLSMKSVSLSLSKKIKSIDFGLGILNFDYGEIEWRPSYPTEEPLIDYSANDFSIILCGGVAISPQGRVGINIKYITEYVYVYSDYALAFDVALSYSNSKSGLSLGAANFGSKLTINNEEVNLPARLSIGGFYKIKNIVGSCDIHYLVNTSAFEFGVGITLPVHHRIGISAALNYRDQLYPGFGLTVNTGLLEVKYGGAFYPYDLGMVNNFGIGLKF